MELAAVACLKLKPLSPLLDNEKVPAEIRTEYLLNININHATTATCSVGMTEEDTERSFIRVTNRRYEIFQAGEPIPLKRFG